MKSAPIPNDDDLRVAKLESYDLLDTLPEQAFDDLTALAAHIMGAPIALVSLIDSDRQWFKSRFGLDAPQTPRDVSFCGHAVAEKSVLVVNNAFEDPRFSDNPLVLGEPRVIFYAGAPLITSDGYALGTLCVIDHEPRELTAAQLNMLEAIGRQVMAQIELRMRIHTHMDALDALRSAEATKDAFISMVNHELRTPLTSISGSLSLLGSQITGPLTPEMTELVAVASRNADRLTAIINDMLDLQKLASDQISFQMAKVHVFELMLEVKRLSAPFAVKHGVELVLDSKCPEARLVADASRLYQVFDNLISNAVKYSPENGRVVVGSQRELGAIRFSITDQGPGIPENFRQHVFDRFAQQSHAGKQFPSTGLGLAIARTIVEAHGGRIGFETTLGEGTTFFFELPSSL